MSAIAYITDSNIIDYHRLRGSETMVFWRFSLRNFSRFAVGDLVFFIDGRTRHPKTNEKGLIGYGRCTQMKNNSPKSTWDMHKTETGYEHYKDFTEAIKFYRKNDHRLPQQLQVIKLDGIVFFQNPIFLSEIDIEISSRLESFTYIEKDGKDSSVELLEIGKLIGVDAWVKSQNSNISKHDISRDITEQSLRRLLEDIEVNYIDKQIRLIKNHTNCVVINNIFYTYENSNLVITFPITHKSQMNEMLGVKLILDTLLNKEYEFNVITNANLEEKALHLLSVLNLKLLQI